MTTSTSFQGLKDTPGDGWKQDFGIYQRDSDQYQRIKITHTDRKTKLTDEYHPSINVDTGDIYLDCRRRKIFAKHCTLAVLRPLHTIVKTAWHASLIFPLIREIYRVLKGKQTKSQALTRTIQNFADIFRTPAYGLAITVTHICGIILGVIRPNTLYKTRQIAGNLDLRMLRVERYDQADLKQWKLAPCFAPFENIEKMWSLCKGDKAKVNSRLVGFGKRQIKHRRTCNHPCNDYGRKFPTNQAYVSAAAA